MAFRVRTVLEEAGEERPRVAPQPPPTVKKPRKKAARETPPPVEEKIARVAPPVVEEERRTVATPEPVREPVKRNPKALGSAEAKDVLFEVIGAKISSGEITVLVEVSNMTEDSRRNVAMYDENYRWGKSKLTDTADKEYEVSQVVFWKGDQKTSMYEAGSRGVPLDARTTQTAQLIFKKVPTNLKMIKKLTIHPFVYWRVVFVWKWVEQDLPFENIRVSR